MTPPQPTKSRREFLRSAAPLSAAFLLSANPLARSEEQNIFAAHSISPRLRIGNHSTANEPSLVESLPLQPGPPSIDRLRIIVIADREAKGPRKGIEHNAASVFQFFNYVFNNPDFPRLQGRAQIIDWNRSKSNGAMPSLNLLPSYFNLYPLQPNEGILLYYTGHGAVELGYGAWRHLLATSVGDYDRASLKWDLLREKSPVVYLITDTCSSTSLAVFDQWQKRQRQPQSYSNELTLGNETLQRFYENLFLQQRGMLDVTSSGIGQPSWCPPSGGFFTNALLSILRNPPLMDPSGDSFSSWQEVFPMIRAQTIAAFNRERDLAAAELEAGSVGGNDPLLGAGTQDPVAYYYPYTKTEGAYFTHIEPRDTGGGSFGGKTYPRLKAFKIYGGALRMKGRRITLAVSFFDRDRKPLKATNPNYQDRRGNVAVTTSVDIKSDFDLIRNNSLRIKLSDIVPSPGLGKSHYKWQIRMFEGTRLLAESYYWSFSMDGSIT